jgi:hypothetical protein
LFHVFGSYLALRLERIFHYVRESGSAGALRIKKEIIDYLTYHFPILFRPTILTPCSVKRIGDICKYLLHQKSVLTIFLKIRYKGTNKFTHYQIYEVQFANFNPITTKS